jgi:hypothetical protein
MKALQTTLKDLVAGGRTPTVLLGVLLVVVSGGGRRLD